MGLMPALPKKALATGGMKQRQVWAYSGRDSTQMLLTSRLCDLTLTRGTIQDELMTIA
jgi:hypothetical protein